MTEQTLCILPCAGFGTRMKMSPNKSKEMLIDPKTGKYLIDYSLDLCTKYDLKPLIITRPEKTDLIDYVTKLPNVDLLFTDGEGEWPGTVLKSESRWHENNILMLPDTRFEPDDLIDFIKHKLSIDTKLVFGVHEVEIQIPWGIIEEDKSGSIFSCEKPITKYNAWGVIGFKKDAGNNLFTRYSIKNSSFYLEKKIYLCEFTKFLDITRAGKIEDY